ncbi:MAG: hypothetical protein HY238_07730 [Acidobacteria bacterium]|nr:hypothetical protein [Acidobacteriota bacterium]
MTKVLIRFKLQSPLTESSLAHLADARSVYGVFDFQLAAAGTTLAVEYDATRLRPDEVAAVLHRAGIPAVRE